MSTGTVFLDMCIDKDVIQGYYCEKNYEVKEVCEVGHGIKHLQVEGVGKQGVCSQW